MKVGLEVNGPSLLCWLENHTRNWISSAKVNASPGENLNLAMQIIPGVKATTRVTSPDTLTVYKA
jgi:hypothetical protein